jgi:predicted DCC family thiol-disulfide oxidoreductase YuxK
VQETPRNLSADAVETPAAEPRPLLVYDGDCGFCAYWARYWQKLTGDRIEYRPYQEVAARYPAISQTDFQRAVQFIPPDGHHASAAEASFLALSHASGRGFWLALCRRLPGFAPVSELAYAFIAAHRPAFFRVSLLFWGRNHEPSRYDLVSFLFLRLFGLIYLSAFVSFAVQAQGLIGSRGILPLSELVADLASRLGPQRFFLMPMLFWINDSDLAIQVVCWAGVALSLLLVIGVLPRLSLALLYALYLSLFYAGQTFMSFQWDTFLLETGFVALLMSLVPTTGVWLSRWLLFRFMFMSGAVKLLSEDPNWRNLSALSYHFLTQPLPTPLASYAAQLPAELLKFATGATFFVELVLPFLIFCPRRLRFFSGFGNSDHRQLQLVQSSDDAAVPSVVRRRGDAEGLARPPGPARSVALRKHADAARGYVRRQRGGAVDRILQPGADG